VKSRVRFTLWFSAACAAGAMLVKGLYGINKNAATPAWCLWACVITGMLWLFFYYICDVRPVKAIGRPLAIAGQNVLLAYLISEMLPGAIDLFHLDNFYDHLAGPTLFNAIARSAGCGVVILFVVAGLNKAGFRLKL
jgi:predicted acyltransferase